jgi:hypothetical protein
MAPTTEDNITPIRPLEEEAARAGAVDSTRVFGAAPREICRSSAPIG